MPRRLQRPLLGRLKTTLTFALTAIRASANEWAVRKGLALLSAKCVTFKLKGAGEGSKGLMKLLTPSELVVEPVLQSTTLLSTVRL